MHQGGIPQTLIEEINNKLNRNAKLRTEKALKNLYTELSSKLTMFSLDIVGMIEEYAREICNTYGIKLEESEIINMIPIIKNCHSKELSAASLETGNGALMFTAAERTMSEALKEPGGKSSTEKAPLTPESTASTGKSKKFT